MPNSLDFVSYWWAVAAKKLISGELRQFGLVTTKSIAQVTNRSVISTITNNQKFQLTFAVPNHPWVDDSNAAAVRVAFTVGGRKRGPGKIFKVASERKIIRGEPPFVELNGYEGEIHADLNVGVDVTAAKALRGNAAISFQGCKLGHDDFQIEPGQLQVIHGSELLGKPVRKYIGGDQIKDNAQPTYVIDLFGLNEAEVMDQYPAAYQHLYDLVKPFKDEVRRPSHRDRWWLFGEPRPELRHALKDLRQYIVTVEVSKHRYFVFEPWPEVLIDGSVVGLAVDSLSIFATLHSRVHSHWALRLGGRMGAGNDPRYQNTLVFDKFPFPRAVQDDENIELSRVLTGLGARLDRFRKQRLSEHAFLSMTDLYNSLERFLELENGCDVPPLTDAERKIRQAGAISVLKDIHDEIDRTVLQAYGWEDLIPGLVGKPGATVPTTHKTTQQEDAEEELLIRLVALNHDLAEEESRGHVRWLRTDYQKSKFATKASMQESESAQTVEIQLPEAVKNPIWPKDGLEQIRLVRDLLKKAPEPTRPETIASAFDGRNTPKRKERVAEVLETLVATVRA